MNIKDPKENEYMYEVVDDAKVYIYIIKGSRLEPYV